VKTLVNQVLEDKAKKLQREYNKQYLREWRQRPENKEKMKQYRKNYWAKRAAAMEGGLN